VVVLVGLLVVALTVVVAVEVVVIVLVASQPRLAGMRY
jgi:hypothetical protein